MKGATLSSPEKVGLMFEISAFLFYKKGSMPSLGFPVFKHSQSNYLYVSQTDNYYRITDFQKIDNTSLFYSHFPDELTFHEVGNFCPFCIMFRNETTLVCDIPYMLANRNLLPLGQAPFLDIELARILGDANERQIEASYIVSQGVFGKGMHADNWVQDQIHSMKNENAFWGTYQRERQQGNKDLLDEIGIRDINEALWWLSSSTNFPKEKWPQIWRLLYNTNPFDQMLLTIACEWIAYHGSFISTYDRYSNLSELMWIIARVMESDVAEYDIESIIDVVANLVQLYKFFNRQLLEDPTSADRLDYIKSQNYST